jgi:aryl-alcohol dehydrogenase-like predicted oxidoreductase
VPQFFAPLRAVLEQLQARWTAAKVTPLAACLSYILEQPQVDAAILGVNHVHEFEEIVAAVAAPLSRTDLFEPIGAIDSLFLDPRQWPATIR